MNLEFGNLEVLEQELDKIPPLHRVAFTASICERLLPNYNAFAREADWGDPLVLRNALDEVWLILQGNDADVAKIRQLIEDCADAVPDSNEVGGGYCFEAQEAAMAVYGTLRLYLNPTPQLAIYVAERVKDTLFTFVDWVEASKDLSTWEEKNFQEQMKVIVSHPLVVRELAKEWEDLQRLKELDTLDREFLEQLRTSNDGKSVLDLS